MSDLSLHDLPASDRHERRGRRRRKHSHRVRTTVVLLLCLALVGAAGYAGYGFLRPIYDDLTEAKDYPGPGAGVVEVQIQQGASGRAIGAMLEEQDVVKTAGAFVAAYEADSRAATIQPGTYQLSSHMSGEGALVRLLDPAAKIALKVTLPEAIRAVDALELIATSTGVPLADLQGALADPAVGLPPEAAGNPDGYLYPATYTFDPDVGAVQIMAAIVARHVQAMDALGVPAAARRALLIKASLVEAEVKRPEDYAKVARVIENRLAVGQQLQLDTTVDYATGKRGVTTTPADRATNSPYNTYVVAGLPAGPINSPGEAGLKAAMAPEPGPWLFFVAVNPDTGETRFAVTLAEHEVNVALFQAWLAANPE